MGQVNVVNAETTPYMNVEISTSCLSTSDIHISGERTCFKVANYYFMAVRVNLGDGSCTTL